MTLELYDGINGVLCEYEAASPNSVTQLINGLSEKLALFRLRVISPYVVVAIRAEPALCDPGVTLRRVLCRPGKLEQDSSAKRRVSRQFLFEKLRRCLSNQTVFW